MCYGLRGILEPRDGQIAHLDRDRSNPSIDNLAYLCLECHKTYDTKNNRVLSFTAAEMRQYRTVLHRALRHNQVEWTITVRADRSQYEAVKKGIADAHAILRQCAPDVSLSETAIE